MGNEYPLVAIIILNYRQAEMTVACVRSLSQLTYSNYQIIIVDGGSGDDSVELFRRELPEICLLEVNENRGYCGGNNVGIRYALKNGADYVHILNPDTLVENGEYLAKLVDYMELNVNVGVVGPKVYWHRREVVQNTILQIPSLWRHCAKMIFARLGSSYWHSGDTSMEVEALNGVCILVRRKCFEGVGLFDEQIFMFCDEVDLGWRVRQAGWKIVYLPIESIIHYEKVRTEPTDPARFLGKRNRIYLMRKMGNPIQAWIMAEFSLVVLAYRALVAMLMTNQGSQHWLFFCDLLRAYRAALCGKPLPLLKLKRKD